VRRVVDERGERVAGADQAESRSLNDNGGGSLKLQYFAISGHEVQCALGCSDPDLEVGVEECTLGGKQEIAAPCVCPVEAGDDRRTEIGGGVGQLSPVAAIAVRGAGNLVLLII